MAGLQKGRGKEFGHTRARVRGRNKKVFLSFSSRDRKSLSLSKDCYAGQRKDSKRLESLSARLFAKKLCEHVKLEYIREVDVAGRWRRHNQVTQRQKLLFHSLFYCIFALMYFLIFTFFTVTLPPKISCISICEMKWTQGKSDKAWKDLGYEASAILVKIIYSSYECVKVNLLKKKGRK